jgi:hypothetical protein
MAGCGSDSGSNASATGEAAAPLSKAQFVKQAEQICAKGLKEKDKAVATAVEGKSPPSQGGIDAKELEELVNQAIVPSYRQILDQLDQLGAPTSDQTKIDTLISEFESALAAVKSDPVGATKKNPFDAVDKNAAAYGLDTCRL